MTKFKPECDLTRLLDLLFGKAVITCGGWKLITKFVGLVSDVVMLKFAEAVIDLIPSPEDMKNITEFLMTTAGSERKILVLKIIKFTEHPNDNPLIFDLLREDLTADEQESIILEKLLEYENKGVTEVIDLLPLIKSQSSASLLHYLWNKYNRSDLINLLGMEQFVYLVDSSFDLSPFENQIIEQLGGKFEHLKIVSRVYCTFAIFKKLLVAFEQQIDYTSCVREYEEMIELLYSLEIERDDRIALERKIQWLANGILDKMERNRILSLLSQDTSVSIRPAANIDIEDKSERDLMEHHLRAFESFKFEEG